MRFSAILVVHSRSVQRSGHTKLYVPLQHYSKRGARCCCMVGRVSEKGMALNAYGGPCVSWTAGAHDVYTVVTGSNFIPKGMKYVFAHAILVLNHFECAITVGKSTVSFEVFMRYIGKSTYILFYCMYLCFYPSPLTLQKMSLSSTFPPAANVKRNVYHKKWNRSEFSNEVRLLFVLLIIHSQETWGE